MIHEYALEPELVATWTDRRVGRYFIEKFGLGQPRIVSRYPKRWKRLVWEAFGHGSELDRTRLEVLLARLSETMVKRRHGPWEPNATWLENAEEDHVRVPFHAILARENPRGHDRVLVGDEVDNTTTAWVPPTGRTVARTAENMAGAVTDMLRNAAVVIFIDPHFGPAKRRYRRPLRMFLRAVVDARPGDAPRRIEVHCDADSGETEEFFRTECGQQLPACVPRTLVVELVRLRSRAGGECLHNRYILTDVGGVTFGVGLDDDDGDGTEGDTDDIQLLDRAQYERRWREYASETPVFDRLEPATTIEGIE